MASSPRTFEDLALVRTLGLNNWYIAAGYVRNQVWYVLHGRTGRKLFEDVDVIYFDESDMREETDREYEKELRARSPSLNWSVKNQARMHVRNNNEPYADVADAMMRWPETAAAVGITLTTDGFIEIIASHGLEERR